MHEASRTAVMSVLTWHAITGTVAVSVRPVLWIGVYLHHGVGLSAEASLCGLCLALGPTPVGVTE